MEIQVGVRAKHTGKRRDHTTAKFRHCGSDTRRKSGVLGSCKAGRDHVLFAPLLLRAAQYFQLFRSIFCVALLAIPGYAQAFGINDILIPIFHLGVKATGNAVGNLIDMASETASGKRSREALLADKKDFLENAYASLEKSCSHLERRQLDPAKAVMTDIYEEAFAGELDGTVSRNRRALLSLDDLGEAALTAPGVAMTVAEFQVKAYQAGVGTIGGRTKWETERMMDAAEASLKDRQTIQTVSMPRLPSREPISQAGLGTTHTEQPGYFRDPVLREPCVKGQMELYLTEIKMRSQIRLERETLSGEAAVTRQQKGVEINESDAP